MDLFDVSYIPLYAVAVLMALCFVTMFDRRRRNYPPGPATWPFLGSVPYLVRLGLPPLKFLSKLPEEYGDIAYLRLLGIDVVVLSEYGIVKEAFQRADFSSRPEPIYSTIAGRPNFGLVSGSGDVSREQRQIAHAFFRTFGVGKTKFEDKITAEIAYLLEEFQNTKGKPFDPKQAVNNAVSNVICAVVFGSRHDYDDPVFNGLLAAVNDNLTISKSGGIFFFLHKLAGIPYSPGYRIRQNVSCIITQLKTCLAEHHADHVPNSPRDMIDMYIDKIEENKKSGSVMSYDETNLLFTLADIFSGGTETTTTVLRWLLLYMISKPDVQAKVQSEIDNVVGREKLPNISDRSDMPYTEAVIWETQRLCVPIPLGVPHQYRGQETFRGYQIPEGALVVANNWRMSHDPRIWDDPEVFKPEHFLDKDGKFVRPDEMIPFSIGKRVCIGESLAKMELFLTFSSLLHQFTFKMPDGVTSYPLQGSLGAVYMPEPFQLCAVTRD